MKKSVFRKITQHQVAKLAGVSQTTVSLVLSNPENRTIPEETRQRVLRAVKQLNYVPDRSAQSLRTKKTFTIAAIIPDITNPFYPAYVRGIQDVCRKFNYDLVTYNTDGKADEEHNSLRSVKRNQADGLIITAFHLKQKDLLQVNCPIVQLIQKPNRKPLFDSIYIDNVAAARSVVNHLVKQGHRRIGMIAGQEDTPPRSNRIEGYRQALLEHDLPLDEILIRGGDFSEAGGYEGMRELLRFAPAITAVFAANDLMAMGAMIAIREAGLRIPADIAVAGFDDIPAARMLQPSLTTITQFQENIGRKSAEMLFDRFNGSHDDEPRLVEMPFELIVRDSTRLTSVPLPDTSRQVPAG